MTEEKVKFLMRIDPDTDRKIKAVMPRSNCRGQKQFVDKAGGLYCGYLAAEDVAGVPAPIFCPALSGRVRWRGGRILTVRG